MTRWMAAVALFAVGGIVRTFLRGPIGDALDIAEVGLSPDDDFDLFVFDLPFGVLIFGSLILGWVMNQGAAVQAQTEDIV